MFARPIGVPGWPLFAFSTASIARVLIVLTASSICFGEYSRAIRASKGRRPHHAVGARKTVPEAVPAVYLRFVNKTSFSSFGGFAGAAVMLFARAATAQDQ